MPCKCIGAVDVVVYRFPDSAEGKLVKQFFDRKGVCYEDLDVSADSQAFQRMQSLSGQTERPVTIINDRVFVGFAKDVLEPFVPSFF